MNTRILILICMMSLLCLQTIQAQGTSSASIEVILVEASNSDAGTDASLKPHASTLKRLFNFKSYKQISRKTTKVNLPGEQSLKLGNGTELKISARSGGKQLSADFDWRQGKRSLVHTRLQLNSGKPAVLGGPRSKDGNYLILITWKK